MEYFLASLFEAIKNPLFWISLLSAIAALALYLINKKTFSFICAKPIIEIIEISIRPMRDDGSGGQISRPRLAIKIINPSSFGNYFSVRLKRYRFLKRIKKDTYLLGHAADGGSLISILPFKCEYVEIEPDYETMKKYEGKNLVIIVKDFRNKKTYKRFRLQNTKEEN